MNTFFLSLGLIGSVVSVIGNFPMLFHLIRVKDSTGQSLNAWLTWQVANVLLLTYAIYVKDFVFIMLQTMWVIFVTITIYLIIAYKKKGVNESTN